MLTEETRALIDDELDNLLGKVSTTVETGLAEDMSPNGIEYDKELDTRWESAIVYLKKVLRSYE